MAFRYKGWRLTQGMAVDTRNGGWHEEWQLTRGMAYDTGGGDWQGMAL